MKRIFYLLLPLFFACTEEIITVKEVQLPAPPQDTVTVIQTIIQTDTIFTVYSIDPTYKYLVDLFYQEAEKYGWGKLPKKNLILERWEIADIQANGYPDWYKGEGVSIAYLEEHQWHAKVNEILNDDRMYIPVLRELGRSLLGKPYSENEDDIMNPKFDCRKFTERPYDEPVARPYLDKLFEKQ